MQKIDHCFEIMESKKCMMLKQKTKAKLKQDKKTK